MRAAVYDRFWHSMGGGERHAGMIAQVLSQDGVEVDLLGHGDVDRDELGEHLGLDLSRTRMRSVADRGDGYVAALSSEYDLFVNATYMSTLLPRSRRSAYLCFFPTPFDHDLPAWRKAAVRALGPWLTGYRNSLAMGWGTGWYPPEGGRLRQWTWTNGDAIMRIEPGVRHDIQLDLGRPGMAEPVQVTVEDDRGEVLATFTAEQVFHRQVLTVPDSPEGRELHFRSKTTVPGPQDTRELGVAVSRLRLAGAGGFGPRAQLAARFPWLLRDPRGVEFLSSYATVMANSEYTRGWIQRLWRTDADVLYPPIQVDRLHPQSQRDKVVLSVGRFFAPGLGHAKRQLEMVQMFGALHRSGRLPGWSMIVLGGCEPFQRPYLETVRAAAEGLPVRIVPNAPRPVVEQAMSTASVFWSATGYGEDEERAPWAHEHFGMTTAEAMAGGCVPIVIDKAGQREIVRDGEEGFRWSTPDQLAERTVRVATDPELRARMSAASVRRAQAYSDEAFALRWRQIATAHDLLGQRASSRR
ncbi:MAG TPA: glycosyltransferase [Mycobacteriales bacterium]|nr:glycosyltransferase [Mycobacteriales bacterium]